MSTEEQHTKSYTLGQTIPCIERKAKGYFKLVETREAKRIQIDGGLLPKCTEPKRCDYLIRTNTIERFIELKGSHIEDAIDQFKQSIERFGQVNKKIICYIIYSGNINGSRKRATKQKFQKNFKEKLQDELIIRHTDKAKFNI